VDVPFTGNFLRWAHTVGYSVVLLDPARVRVGGDLPRGKSAWSEQDALRALTAALHTVREDAGFTQRALADQLGVSGWTFSMWETAVRAPRLVRLITWADWFGCRVELEPVVSGGVVCGL
jgi:DNA-binding XRE family transcriptional regulator